MNERSLDITTMANVFGRGVCQALVGLHPLTGCDSTSALYRKGKKDAFKLIMASDEFIPVLGALGQEFETSADLMRRLEKFICHLYGNKQQVTVNKCRHHMFTVRRKFGEEQLCPNDDACHLHFARAGYQAAIFRRCMQQYIRPPPPTTFGWREENGSLTVVWQTKKPAPDSALELVSCACKQARCLSNNCSCRRHSMLCTDMCKCTSCENTSENTQIKASDEEEEEEEEEEEDYDVGI